MTIPLTYGFNPVLPNECTKPTYTVNMIENIGGVPGSVAQLSLDYSSIQVDAPNKL